MKSVVCVDTNIIIRFLQADHAELSPRAREIILGMESGKYKIYFDEVIIAETIWTLTSHYELAKPEVVEKIYKLVSRKWAINPRKTTILKSLRLYLATNLGYIDCWIAEVSKTNKFKLKTFDKNLQKQV